MQLYNIKKVQRTWQGGLYVASFYNEKVDKFGAVRFATKFELEDAVQTRVALSAQWKNPFVTISIDVVSVADDYKTLVPDLEKDTHENS